MQGKKRGDLEGGKANCFSSSPKWSEGIFHIRYFSRWSESGSSEAVHFTYFPISPVGRNMGNFLPLVEIGKKAKQFAFFSQKAFAKIDDNKHIL